MAITTKVRITGIAIMRLSKILLLQLFTASVASVFIL